MLVVVIIPKAYSERWGYPERESRIATDEVGVSLQVSGMAVVVNADDESLGFLNIRATRCEDTDRAKTKITLRFNGLTRALTRMVYTKTHFPRRPGAMRREQGAFIAGRALVVPWVVPVLI
jgi:hypothetical protein